MNSIILLLDTDSADPASVVLLLRQLIDGSSEAETDAPSAPDAAETEVGDMENISDEEALQEEAASTGEPPADPDYSKTGLPAYKVNSFIKALLQDKVQVDVPEQWGNNGADSGRACISYSSENGSGAISPSAGTLLLSYYPMTAPSESEEFDQALESIASMNVTTSVTSEDITAAQLPAREIDYTMSVGSNQYICSKVCFAYEQTVYAIELMQGIQSEYDFFSMYDHIVKNAQTGSWTKTDISTEKETDEETDKEVVIESVHFETEDIQDIGIVSPDASETEKQISINEVLGTSDPGSFMYMLNGHGYQFPTNVADIRQGDLPLNPQLELPYRFSSDADMDGGQWTEIVNTQCYFFENSLYKEMAGVTNMSGYPVPMTEGIVTALIDTRGDYINVTLPGGLRVGGAESDIIRAFPEFEGKAMDGMAGFRGNELLYACNVRPDGTNGYVLIRNDEPFYSAVSLICDNGVITEISFECLGSARAEGVFL